MDINTGRIIKARLAALGKTQKDLFVELNRRGAQLSTVQQLYQYINGYSNTLFLMNLALTIVSFLILYNPMIWIVPTFHL